MPSYSYVARNQKGKRMKGTVESESRQHAVNRLAADGLLVVSITDNKSMSTSSKSLGKLFQSKVKPIDLALFARQFATMYAAGVPIAAILRALAEQSENKTLKLSLQDVIEEVTGGSSLGESLKKHPQVFPELMVNLVRVGEAGGSLDESMERLADFYTREHELGQKIATAMYYPIAVGIMAVLVTWLLLVKVVPNFVTAYSSAGAELPLPTRILIGVSYFLQSYGLIVFGLLVSFVLSIRWYFRTEKGQHVSDRLRLHMPVFGRLAQLNALSRFCRVFATLIRSGVNTLSSLDLVAASVQNSAIAEVIFKAKELAQEGVSVVDPMEQSPYFPPMLVHMMRVGEESGTTDAMLEKVADFYDRDIANMTERMSKLLEPLVSVVLAVIVGGILLAVVTPMFDMMRLVK